MMCTTRWNSTLTIILYGSVLSHRSAQSLEMIHNMPAFCVKLEKVPGLSSDIKVKVRRFIGVNNEMGIHNVLQRFNPERRAR